MRDIIYGGISFVVVTTFILLTAGCLLNVSTPYYLPAATGGTIVRAMQPRTNSVILFKRQGVIIGVNTTDYGDRFNASISFEVPEGKIVQLLEHHIEVSGPSKESWKSNLSGHIWTGPGRIGDFPVNTPMIGKNEAWRFGTAKGYGNTGHAAFFFKAFLFATPGPKTFVIKMPKFRVNNMDVELPLIEFTFGIENLWIAVP
jgi:hypothetical protein